MSDLTSRYIPSGGLHPKLNNEFQKIKRAIDNLASLNAPVRIYGGNNANNNSLQVDAPNTDALAAFGAGRALALLGGPNSYTEEISGSATNAQSYGLLIEAGTTAADNALLVNNQARTNNLFRVRGDGAIHGRGPTAATLLDMAPDQGTYTLTYTGAGAQSGTATWRKFGPFIFLALPSPTLNAGVGTAFGGNLPAVITPSFSQTVSLPAGVFIDNGARMTTAIFTATTGGTFTIPNGTGAALVAGGNRGISSTNPVVWWCLA